MNFDYDALIQQNILFLYSGILLVAAGIILFEIQSRKTLSIILIILGAIGIRVFVALIDPFLHLWDEQIHALVAKNMMDNPFMPMLIRDPLLYFDYKNWTGNHIWLHKQPFFLWQIALSFKLFGINEFALRLPDIIMSGIVVLFIYRIGKIAFDERAGFYGAVLFTGSTYLIELTAGRMPTDHNDIAFMFYVTASIWAWFEYSRSKKIYWIVLIGLFSGIAILVKWLTGLLVYSAWALSIFFDKELRRNLGSYIDLLKSLLVTILVALPWQIYILIRFPLESRFEYAYNSLHFFEALEGHSGSWLYHIEAIKEIYSFDFHYIIFVALILLCFIRIKNTYRVALLTWVLVVYVFFTLAATKMMGFTIIVAPMIYSITGIVLAYLIKQLANYFDYKPQAKKLIPLLSMVVIFYMFFHFVKHDKISLAKTPIRKTVYDKAITTALFYKELTTLFPEGDYMFFNQLPGDHIKIMFYSGYRSRSSIPTKNDIKTLNENNVKVVVFDNNKLPDYILNDTTIAKVKSFVWTKQLKGNPKIYY